MTHDEKAKALLEGKSCQTCVWGMLENYSADGPCNYKENLVCWKWKALEERPMAPPSNKIYYQKLVYGDNKDEGK